LQGVPRSPTIGSGATGAKIFVTPNMYVHTFDPDARDLFAVTNHFVN